MDIEYLDDLKVRVFEFVYFKLVHKIAIPNQEEELQNEIAKLSEDEKAYISSFVEECMREMQVSDTPVKK